MVKKLSVLVLAGLLVFGCSEEKAEQSDSQAGQSQEQAQKSDGLVKTDSDNSGTIKIEYTPSDIPFDLNGKPVDLGGIKFVPATQWTDFGPKGMRKASYAYGPLEKETDSATVLVFYFGKTDGGSVEANLDRWINQMSLMDGRDPKSGAIQYKLEVDGMTVHMLSIYGIYSASMGGPMSGQPVEKSNYRMVGAIVEAPEGNVFFKLTGPDYTAKIMIEAFMAMVKSVKKI